MRARWKTVAACLALLFSAPTVEAKSASPSADPAQIVMSDSGPILVTPAGMTLYTYADDERAKGKSACASAPVTTMKDAMAGMGTLPLPGHNSPRSCADSWPPFMAEAGAAPHGDWAMVERIEGKQWTYMGKPLYRSVKDGKPGDRNGDVPPVYNRPGWRLAQPVLGFPPGFAFTRIGDELLITTANGRPVYTPRGAGLRPAALGGDLFAPAVAAELARTNGDWSVVEVRPGVRQYAFRGKPLHAAPDGLTNREIAQRGDWQPVVYRKLAGTPSDIGMHFTLLGDVYTDRVGKTLYMFDCWVGGLSSCEEPGGPASVWAGLCGEPRECSRRWRPYLAPASARPLGDWSVVEVPDPIFSDPAGQTYGAELPRVKAWAYRGRPAYTYFEDKEPGDVWGHNVRWYLTSGFAAIQVPGKGVNEW